MYLKFKCSGRKKERKNARLQDELAASRRQEQTETNRANELESEVVRPHAENTRLASLVKLSSGISKPLNQFGDSGLF